MEDLSALQSKLIGINCLPTREADCVYALWAGRFHGHCAFWVDAASGMSTGEIFDRIRQAIISQDIKSMTGVSCVVAVFLDLTCPPEPALVEALTAVPGQLQAMLGCRVSLVYTFAWLGIMAPDDRAALRNRIASLSRANTKSLTIRRQICLVAQPPLADTSTNHWKAAIICLDLLRRKSSPDDILPPVGSGGANNDVGFLRYGEFDDGHLRLLQTRKRELEQALSDSGDQAFRDALCAAYQKLETDITHTIHPDPGAQPLHPGLFVEGWLKRKAAKRGINNEFNQAQRLTQDAILATGKEITDQSLAIAQTMSANAGSLLRQLLDASKVGIALESDRIKMEQFLEPGLQRVDIPTIPALRYQENGYNEEIGEYFRQTLRRSIYLAKCHWAQALLTAYRAITDEDLARRATQYRQELDLVKHELSQTVRESDFYDSARRSGNHLESCFSPQAATTLGGTRRHLLCREKETALRLTTEYGSPELSINLIGGTAAGLKTLDAAPVKALHILSFDCTPDCLLDLIREVE